ncbi:K(+) efflux antiporter 4 [Camellia lanceoleosa]|uniref:K(+) efflux antiporter 4 n=1 Tax=Camellia lanceoleosa TaxID=1840588 RepID=A0ACC0F3B4_9ERIC|nr:K(+) efflux antiporter 4 [Camellia lanceoleosa]
MGFDRNALVDSLRNRIQNECSDNLGLSLELGSFAAGVMISTTNLAQHTLEQLSCQGVRLADYKTSLLVGMSLAQIGEFAFVLLSRASNLHLVEALLEKNPSIAQATDGMACNFL